MTTERETYPPCPSEGRCMAFMGAFNGPRCQRVKGHTGPHNTRPGPPGVPMTERETLLPCPHCEGVGRRDRTLRDGCKHGEPDAWAYYVRCVSCAAQGGWAKSEAGGDRWWNQRATPLAGPVVWVACRANGDLRAREVDARTGEPFGPVYDLPHPFHVLGAVLQPGECKRVRLTVMEGEQDVQMGH